MAGADAAKVWMFASEEDQAAFETEDAVYAAFADAPSRLRGISAALSVTVFSLPSSSNLTEGELARVVAALVSWRGRQVPWSAGESSRPQSVLSRISRVASCGASHCGK